MAAESVMDRYIITVVSTQKIRLLVPSPTSSSVSDLKVELSRRLAKQGLNINASQLQLRLGSSDGPLLDNDDLLEHVVINPGEEDLICLIEDTASSCEDNKTKLAHQVSISSPAIQPSCIRTFSAVVSTLIRMLCCRPLQKPT
jgi:hypothetical protein